VCLHITSLPGPHGIGELGESAFHFIDTIAAMGLTVWQFLPVGPVTYADSPYQAASTFAGNPLLIDLSSLCEEGLLAAEELGELGALSRDRVDFGAVIPRKTELLYRAAARFETSATAARTAARTEFAAANDEQWLHNYALYQVLREKHERRAWGEWEHAQAMRDPDALLALEASATAEIGHVKTIQFLFFEQWARLKAYAAERGVSLMGDLPIYAALDSADVWERKDLFAFDDDGAPSEVGGVPPDYFSEDGQRWGNPLYRWERHAAEGFGWWIARFRHLMGMFDLIRLDHFRGFDAYWAVPFTADSAREGEWRPGPGAALFEALKESLGELPIIAEDLGHITPEVEALRRQFGFPGMKVLQFMVGEPEFDLAGIPADCVCYTGTHDNDTTVGWFHGGPGDVRTAEEVQRMQAIVLEHARGSTATIHEDMIRLALSSRAELVIVPMQDFLGLGSESRMNTPGTTEGNWQWRVLAEDLTPALNERIGELVASSGRDPRHPNDSPSAENTGASDTEGT
jgi:4-alpha-glucanotransferase